MDRSEAVTQNVPKVLAAFVTGLVTVFGGALIYSNLQWSSEPAQTVQHARWERPAPSVNPPASAVVPSRNLPENSIQAEGRKSIPPSTTSVLPEHSMQSTTVLVRPALVQKTVALPSVSALSNAPHISSNGLVPQLSSNPNVLSQLPPALMQDSKKVPSSPEQNNASVEQPQHAASVPAQNHPEPISSASESKMVVVPATTILEVQLAETLSSDLNRPGDRFRATLASPLIMGGYLLAEAGTTVLGRVETSRRAPLIGGKAELSVTLTEIDTSDGARTRVETGERKVKGTRGTLTNTAKMATGAAVGGAEGAGMTSSSLEKRRESSRLMAGPRTASFPAGAQLTFILVAPFTATGTRPR